LQKAVMPVVPLKIMLPMFLILLPVVGGQQEQHAILKVLVLPSVALMNIKKMELIRLSEKFPQRTEMQILAVTVLAVFIREFVTSSSVTVLSAVFP
jgi:hypothetical protein